MKVLGIDTSSLATSVAVIEDNKLICEYTINTKKTHSQKLMPMIENMLNISDLNINEIDLIAVCEGPGSFTGLRIGSATAKGLALALDKQIVSVPTIDAMAYNLWGSNEQICPIMDARRNQVYTGLYQFVKEHMNTILPECVLMIDEIVAKVNESGKKTIFLGDGVAVFKEYIEENIKVPYAFAPANNNKQRASSVAALGMELYKEGKAEDAKDHKPEYLRLSQAERERQEKARDFKIC